MTVENNNKMVLSKAERGEQLAGNLDALSVQIQEAWLMEGNFARTIAYGLAVAELREALNEKVMKALMKLKNSKMGFRTDEGPKTGVYSMEVVRDAVIEAATLGLQCVGNQFNILGGNMYVTKEGFTFLLRELVKAGRLQGMRFVYHPAEIKESSTQGVSRSGEVYQKIEREGLVKVEVSCVWDGKRVEECLEFVIRVNAGMSQDAVLGKAERKAKAWLYNYLTDQAVSDGEAEVQAEAGKEMRDVTPKVVEPVFLARPTSEVVTPSDSGVAESLRSSETPVAMPIGLPGKLPMFGELV